MTGATNLATAAAASPVVTIGGTPSVNAAGYLRIISSNTATNWEIATNQYVTGLSIVPSTTLGGSTFTTPVFNVLTTGASITGTLSSTGAISVSGATGAASSSIYNSGNEFVIRAGTTNKIRFAKTDNSGDMAEINATGTSITGTLGVTGLITSTVASGNIINAQSATTNSLQIKITNGSGTSYVGTDYANALSTGSTNGDLVLRGEAGVSITANNGAGVQGRFTSTGASITGTLGVTGVTTATGGVITSGASLGSIATATATTMFSALPVGMYIAKAMIPSTVYSSTYLIVHTGGANMTLTPLVLQANIVMTQSTYDIQVTQSLGSNQTVTWTMFFIPG